ncbi:hypothetical protein D3C87_2107340 [compost metagenome]
MAASIISTPTPATIAGIHMLKTRKNPRKKKITPRIKGLPVLLGMWILVILSSNNGVLFCLAFQKASIVVTFGTTAKL